MIKIFDVKPLNEDMADHWNRGLMDAIILNTLELKYKMRHENSKLKAINIHGNVKELDLISNNWLVVQGLPIISKQTVPGNVADKLLLELIFEKLEEEYEVRDTFDIIRYNLEEVAVRYEMEIKNNEDLSWIGF